jgi:type I restriction-modification system DNA methylase subunit
LSAPDDDRKATGAYYTPTVLVDLCIDSALDPQIAERAPQPSLPGDPAADLLELKVLDPACGAGAFPVRAARRIARRVAQLRAWSEDPPLESYQRALWDVVNCCIHAVDLNPHAVELCKIVLWMEAAREGVPLPFLEPNIQHGNSLLGATPKMLAQGVPDEAWEALTGDDPKVAKELKKRNREERRAWEKAQKEADDDR